MKFVRGHWLVLNRSVYLVLCTLLFAFCLPVQAQQSTRVPKIGFLGVRPDDSKATFELLKRELGTLGYIDGKNIVFEYRNAENKPERLPGLVNDLIREKVNVLVVAATNEAPLKTPQKQSRL